MLISVNSNRAHYKNLPTESNKRNKKVFSLELSVVACAIDQGMTGFKQLIRDSVEKAAGDEVKLQAKLKRKDKKRAGYSLRNARDKPQPIRVVALV